MNPWVSMWSHPRTTIRAIVETQPTRGVLPLAMVGILGYLLDNGLLRLFRDADIALPIGIPTAVVMSAVAGPVGLYLFGGLFTWIGRQLGGRGTAVHIRAAIAWSLLPLIAGLLVWLPALALWGPGPLAGTDAPAAIQGLSFVRFLLGVWCIVLLSRAVGEVHRCSGGMGFVTTMVGALLGFVILVVVCLPIVFLAKAFLARCCGA